MGIGIEYKYYFARFRDSKSQEYSSTLSSETETKPPEPVISQLKPAPQAKHH